LAKFIELNILPNSYINGGTLLLNTDLIFYATKHESGNTAVMINRDPNGSGSVSIIPLPTTILVSNKYEDIKRQLTEGDRHEDRNGEEQTE